MRSSILSAVAVLGILSPLAANAQGRPTQAEIIASCESCHGRDGQTRNPTTPRLNGQTREYLIARLKDLRNPGNQTVSAIHNMLWPARGLLESDIPALAAHFAAQKPNSPAGRARGRDAGALLYARGDSTRSPYAPGEGARLPSCASCHGDAGQGQGEAPRLAGQHASYLVDQMEALMLTARFQPGMNRHAQLLTPQEIRDLAAFLAGD